MKKHPVLTFLIGAVVAAVFIAGVAFDDIDPSKEIVEVKPDNRLQYKWYVPELPKSISFAGENVPLEKWDVRERLQRELLINYYLHSTTLYELLLTTRYFPVIEPILKANNVPDDFKYLCVAESALQHNTSGAGAASLWQLMKPTAMQYGLIVDTEVDERYNVQKATVAACTYFNQAYQKFGTWTAAAASYNCGMSGYSNFAAYQQTTNYYDLIFLEETNRYVYRILALKCLLGNARAWGYIVDAKEAYRPIKSKTLTVDSSITDLAQWSIAQGSNYKMLKLMNPWLRAHTLSARPGVKFDIALPE